MKPTHQVKTSIKHLTVIEDAQRYRRILDSLMATMENTENSSSPAPQPTIRGNIMTILTRNRVAVLSCCVAVLVVVSAAAAVVFPGVCARVQSFVVDLSNKDVPGLVTMADPTYAVRQQLLELPDVNLDTNGLDLATLYAEDGHALAITTDVVHTDPAYDGGRKEGPLVITLVRNNNQWQVTDIDLETADTVQDEIDRFLTRCPDAARVYP